MDVLSLQQLDFDLRIVRETLPTDAAQFGLKRCQSLTTRGQQIAPARSTEELQGVLADHAAVHHPDPVALAETRFDGGDEALDRLQILGIAGPGVMGQREALA